MATYKRYNGATWDEIGGPINDAYIITYARAGVLSVATGKGLWVSPVDVTILGLSAAVNVAPTGAAINLALENTAGTDFVTTSIAAGQDDVAEGSETITTSAVPAGTRLRINITQVGSTIAGEDLSVFVRYARS